MYQINLGIILKYRECNPKIKIIQIARTAKLIDKIQSIRLATYASFSLYVEVIIKK